ncbi:MAG: putative phage abortive infection protein [Bacteroidia bacterium]
MYFKKKVNPTNEQIVDNELKHNWDYKVIILLIISFTLIGFAIYAPNYFVNYYSKFNTFGQIGDTIGGLMNPFIALAGVFITFLAFYMQFQANNIQIKLFNKNQKEQNNLIKEQLFFRLVDNLNQRIINFSYSESTVSGNADYVSYKSLDNLVKKFLYKIDYKCIALGRQLLAKQPEKIDIVHYIKILQANTLNESGLIENAKELQQAIIDSDDFNKRWEYIKAYVGSTNYENEKQNEALKSIGRVNFYKIDFKQREDLYISTYDEIYRDFGGFMDGYTKNIAYLVDFVMKNPENPFFIDYLKSNLSTQELILIFYFCASRKSNEKTRNQIKKANLLEGIKQTRDKFIDAPSELELTTEIDNILNRFDVTTG